MPIKWLLPRRGHRMKLLNRYLLSLSGTLIDLDENVSHCVALHHDLCALAMLFLVHTYAH